MSGFCIRVWCDDCCGEDFDGCFDGASTLWGKPGTGDPFGRGAPYPTHEEAEADAWRRIDVAPWSYEIVDADEAAAEEAS